MIGLPSEVVVALGLTLGLELAVVLRLAPKGSSVRYGLACVGLNLVSHPLACLAFDGSAASWIGVESAVAAVELLGYRWALGASVRSCARLTAWANLLSAGLGLLIPLG